MKIEGSLKNLVKANQTKSIENKRDQLPPPTKKEKQLEQTKTQNTNKKIKVGRPPIKNQDIKYIRTALELPESIKDDLDRLFLEFKKLKEKGKNQFMVEAIIEKMKRLKK